MPRVTPSTTTVPQGRMSRFTDPMLTAAADAGAAEEAGAAVATTSLAATETTGTDAGIDAAGAGCGAVTAATVAGDVAVGRNCQ